MKRVKEILIPTIALFLICLISTFLLGSTNKLTKDRIDEQAQKVANEARAAVMPEAVSFEEAKDGENAEGIYEALDDKGNVIGYTVTVEGKSYGGDIEIMVGFDNELKVTGVEILSIEDTPGLGMNAKKEEFRDQYKEKTGELTVVKNQSSPAQNEINALTGATITSKAVTSCVNEAYGKVMNYKTGGENNG